MATIGIDATALSTSASGGIGASEYAILRALIAAGSEHRFILYAAETPLKPFTDRPLDLGLPVRLGSGITARSNILWMQTGVNRLLRADGVDLFWSPRHLLPFQATDIAQVATVQDFWHLHYPGQQPLRNRIANRLLIGRILKVADRIVTTSRATAEDAITHYRVPRKRISVVPLGVDTSIFRHLPGADSAPVLHRYGITGRFLLAMDVYNPRKNFQAVLEAFARLPQEQRDRVQLVGLGRPRKTADGADPRAMANKLGVQSRLFLPGDAALADLIALYSTADAFVYPSLYEGFGMPILEAMACGCPVIAGNGSSLPEVAGDAALMVDPADVGALAESMSALLTDGALRERLVASGGARIEAFTWAGTAAGMLRVFDEVLSERGRR